VLTRGIFAVYSAALTGIVWMLLVPYELMRIASGRGTREGLLERLGVACPPRRRRPSPRVIVHAVSAGEMAAAAAFVEELAAGVPGLSVLVTTGNEDGRRVGMRLMNQYPAIEAVVWLPWDRASAVRRWLHRADPDAVIVVETEIWPNLFRVCREQRRPLMIVNGRIYPRDLARYRLARRFFGDVLGCASWIGVQDERERQAFLAIGSPAERTSVAGNLKFDARTTSHGISGAWRHSLEAGRPLIIGGSTHAPEEQLLLGAAARLRLDFPSLRVILAPRHTKRVPQLRELVARQAWRSVLWSDGAPSSGDWDVLLIDRIGVLADLYSQADVAFVGGTIAPRGGQNVLEAVSRGCPAIVGPHVELIRSVVATLKEANAVVCLSDADDVGEALHAQLRRMLSDAEARARQVQHALAVAVHARGSARLCARQVRALMGRASPEDDPAGEKSASLHTDRSSSSAR
jgi:3-deoxy-D-manno-octulosonic-acid transferase